MAGNLVHRRGHQRERILGGGARPRIQYPNQEFKEQIFAEEMTWASEIFGINSIRLSLAANLYQSDREKFFRIFDRILGIAASKGMSVMPTLGMGLRDPAAPVPVTSDQNAEWDFFPGIWGGGALRRSDGNRRFARRRDRCRCQGMPRP